MSLSSLSSMFKYLRVRPGFWPRGEGLKGAPFGLARKYWTRQEKLAIDKNTSSLATPSANRNEKKSFITFDFSMLGEGYEIRASGFLVPVL